MLYLNQEQPNSLLFFTAREKSKLIFTSLLIDLHSGYMSWKGGNWKEIQSLRVSLNHLPHLPNFTFSFQVPLLWCWVSPFPAQTCDDSQAGVVGRTWEDGSFQVASSLLWGTREVEVGEITPCGTSYLVTRPPSYLSVRFSHVSSHLSQNCLNSQPCQEWWAFSPVTPSSPLLPFQRWRRTSAERLRVCPRSKRTHQQRRDKWDQNPFIINSHHYYHRLPHSILPAQWALLWVPSMWPLILTKSPEGRRCYLYLNAEDPKLRQVM